jgi:hypothetical protein
VPLTPTGRARYGHGRRRTRVSPALVAFVVLLALAVGGGTTAYIVKRNADDARHRRQVQAEQTVRGYLAAWSRGEVAAASGYVVDDQKTTAQAMLTEVRRDLQEVDATYTLTGPVSSSGSTPGAAFITHVTLRGLGPWSYTGRLPLARVNGSWRVAWTPAVIHPQLAAGDRLVRTRTLGTRGKVLFRDGHTTGNDTELTDNLRGPVETVKDAKLAAQIGPEVEPGDQAGTSGLEARFNARLAGQAGGTVAVKDPAGHTVATLATYAKKDGTDLTTTLDPTVQDAGEKALITLGAKPAALVALDTHTGAVLAAVNNPIGGFARTIRGTYPPGSTFKVVTTAAALIAGVPVSQTFNCDPQHVINGRTFHNAEKESFGTIDFATAFAKSCNTWFVQLQEKVPLATLQSTAALFGFVATDGAAQNPLPITSYAGSYPTPRDRAQAAGQAIGQDKVLASPLWMAGVAAAVADGNWHTPHVLAPADPAATPVVTHPLPAEVAATLRTFMGGVLAPGGTAAGAGLPAGSYGKTGTAETGSADPKKTDAWFIGVRGGVAVAVEVDGAGFGGAVAAPVAARFLSLLG